VINAVTMRAQKLTEKGAGAGGRAIDKGIQEGLVTGTDIGAEDLIGR
jgi:hypothetical protein